MYLCEHCKQQISANTPSYSFTVQTRPTSYPKRSKANWRYKEHRLEYYADKGGKGFEPVKVLQVCRTCYQQLNHLA